MREREWWQEVSGMRVGFIGLGNMGRHMARHILDGGHELTVHDIRREAAAPLLSAGAAWAESPQRAAEGAEAVFTSLPGPKEIEAVVLGEGGIGEGAARGTVYVDLSTNSPSLIRGIHAEFEQRGVAVLDAPVSGGATGAERATLAVLGGGDNATFQRVRPLLELVGDKVSYVGPSGSGAIAKLVHNMISIASRIVVAEGMTLGVKAGVDPEALLKAVADGSFGQGNLLKRSIPNVVFKGDWENVGFALELSLKDVRLAVELADEFDVPMQMAALTVSELEEAVAEGMGHGTRPPR
jgi:3-hydroxyisobutyrate dehydrogenase